MPTNNAINNEQDPEFPIGAVAYFCTGGTDTTYINTNWLKCDGSTYSQSTYPTLFNRLGLINGNGSYWTAQTYTTSTAYPLSSIAYGNGVYLGIDWTNNDGYTSTDSNTWTRRSGLFAVGMTQALFAGGIFLAAGTNGYIQTSTDALTWTTRTTSGTLQASAVLYAGGLYLVGDSSGNVRSSTDAISWTSTSVTTNGITGIAYGGGVYVAAIGGSSTAYSSTNALTWNLRTVPVGGAINAVTYGNSIFLAGGSAGTDAQADFASSTNGVAWNKIVLPSPPHVICTSLCYGNGIFISGGRDGSIRTSTDAQTWYYARTPLSGQTYTGTYAYSIFSINYYNNTYYSTIGFGVNAASNFFLKSSDTYPYNSATQFQVPIDASANITQQQTNSFQRALYIRAT